MTDNKTARVRTLTLTGRPPVTIHDGDWPEIAKAVQTDSDSPERIQEATRITRIYLRVRQHADGRALVYGRYHYETRHRGERGIDARAGELLDAAADVPAAIARVASQLIDAEADGAWMRRVERACVAKLPVMAL